VRGGRDVDRGPMTNGIDHRGQSEDYGLNQRISLVLN
jgi:hypothetical protein